MSKADMNDDGSGDLRRAYASTQHEQPPAALDAAIIAQARGAVERKSAPRKGSAVWGAPVAVAAMLVVTGSLVMLMEHEQPQIVALAPPAYDAAFAPAPKEPARAVQPADAAPPTLAQALPAAPVRDQTPGQGGPQTGAQVKPQSGLSSRPADAAKASPPAYDRQAFPAARMAESASSSRASVSSAAPTAAARMESGVQSGSVAAPAAASRAAGQASAEVRRLQAREDAAPKVAAPDAAKKDESPAAWLARIAELRKLGRIKEAEESFAEFRKRYPDYPISAEQSDRTTTVPD